MGVVTKTKTATERRRCERIPAVRYTAMIRRAGVLANYLKPIETAVADFNRFGMAVRTDRRFKPGDRLQVELLSPHEHITGLQAVVRDYQRNKPDHRCGLEFVNPLKALPQDSAKSAELLACMEHVIRADVAL